MVENKPRSGSDSDWPPKDPDELRRVGENLRRRAREEAEEDARRQAETDSSLRNGDGSEEHAPWARQVFCMVKDITWIVLALVTLAVAVAGLVDSLWHLWHEIVGR